jgi:hypothetical protein
MLKAFSAAAAVAILLPAQSFAESDASKDPDKVVCKRLKVTGSRVGGKRVCMTRDEWDRMGQETRNEVGTAIGRVVAKGVPPD